MNIPPKITLCIDTSIRGAAVAVLDGNDQDLRLLSYEGDTSSIAASRKLGSLVDEVLLKAGVQRGNLNSIVVGYGPGSFTGIKVGIAFAQGLAFGLNNTRPIRLASSLLAFAQRYGKGTNAIVLKGTRDQGFIAVPDLNGLYEIHPLVLEQSIFWLGKGLSLEKASNEWDEILTVVDWEEFSQYCPKSTKLKAIPFDESQMDVLTLMAQISHPAIDNNCIIPNYLRLSTPEEKLNESK